MHAHTHKETTEHLFEIGVLVQPEATRQKFSYSIFVRSFKEFLMSFYSFSSSY